MRANLQGISPILNQMAITGAHHAEEWAVSKSEKFYLGACQYAHHKEMTALNKFFNVHGKDPPLISFDKLFTHEHLSHRRMPAAVASNRNTY